MPAARTCSMSAPPLTRYAMLLKKVVLASRQPDARHDGISDHNSGDKSLPGLCAWGLGRLWAADAGGGFSGGFGTCAVSQKLISA